MFVTPVGVLDDGYVEVEDEVGNVEELSKLTKRRFLSMEHLLSDGLEPLVGTLKLSMMAQQGDLVAVATGGLVLNFFNRRHRPVWHAYQLGVMAVMTRGIYW